MSIMLSMSMFMFMFVGGNGDFEGTAPDNEKPWRNSDASDDHVKKEPCPLHATTNVQTDAKIQHQWHLNQHNPIRTLPENAARLPLPRLLAYGCLNLHFMLTFTMSLVTFQANRQGLMRDPCLLPEYSQFEHWVCVCFLMYYHGQNEGRWNGPKWYSSYCRRISSTIQKKRGQLVTVLHWLLN